MREHFFLAILGPDNSIERRVSPDFGDQWSGMAAWFKRRDRRAQLVRVVSFSEALT